jgi:shikimate kinase
MKKKRTNIVLTGFRATGKSTVGKIVAEQLGYTFLDTDIELCRQLGASVAEIVAFHGWPFFRQAEAELLHRLSFQTHQVIATGGGAIEHQQQWRLLRRESFVVWLDADVATIQARITSDPLSAAQRPALPTACKTLEDEIVLLLQRRAPLYASGSDVRFDTVGTPPTQLAEQLLDAFRALKGNRNV